MISLSSGLIASTNSCQLVEFVSRHLKLLIWAAVRQAGASENHPPALVPRRSTKYRQASGPISIIGPPKKPALEALARRHRKVCHLCPTDTAAQPVCAVRE